MVDTIKCLLASKKHAGIICYKFDQMDKAIGHCKSGNAAGNVWKYDNKEHGLRCPRAQLEKW